MHVLRALVISMLVIEAPFNTCVLTRAIYTCRRGCKSNGNGGKTTDEERLYCLFSTVVQHFSNAVTDTIFARYYRELERATVPIGKPDCFFYRNDVYLAGKELNHGEQGQEKGQEEAEKDGDEVAELFVGG
jgi:hypothetical protein